MPNPEEKADQVKQSAMKALEDNGRFTPEEREEIASTIESEVAKLLPELPEGIAEIAARAMELSLNVAEKLIDLREHPPIDDQTDP